MPRNQLSSPGKQKLTLQQALDQAVERHTLGDLAQAESIYQQILKLEPNQVVALHLLGVIYYQRGDNDQAFNLITKALDQNPDYSEAHNNFGSVLKAQGKFEAALTSYQRAISINPNFADAHNNLGAAHVALGQFDQAIDCYKKALGINPNFALAYYNYGNVLKTTERLEEAVDKYKKAIKFNPDDSEAYSNAGVAFQGLGKLEDALASFQMAVKLKPDYAEGYNNLGNIYTELDNYDDALANLQKALTIDPNLADAHYNRGTVLKVLGKFDDACLSFKKALGIKPDFAEAYNNLGITYLALGRLEEAREQFEKSARTDPSLQSAGRNLLILVLNIPGLSHDDLFAEHARFSSNYAENISPIEDIFANELLPERPLRLGYLSSDFWDHPVGCNIIPLLSSHDRTAFEVHCYADVRRPDPITERFRSCVDHWHNITGKSDGEVAAMVRADKIDVLISLAGRFDQNRPLVCAYRAAPVQVSFHDLTTSGLKEMDYWLTDHFLHPAGTKEKFSEDLYRLPVFYQYPSIEEAPPVTEPPSKKAGYITFGSFNNPTKVNEEVIQLWSEVMTSVPGSHLLLKYKNWYDQVSLRKRVIERFATCGIKRDRIVFAVNPDNISQHLDHYREIDIALDPFPYNGATTTFQALWMGVPVISLAGNTFFSRAAGSLLYHSGLDDLLADTAETYVARASDLAKDSQRLQKLRATLRERMAKSPLCDAPAYALTVETAYRDMWRSWCNKTKGNL